MFSMINVMLAIGRHSRSNLIYMFSMINVMLAIGRPSRFNLIYLYVFFDAIGYWSSQSF